MHNHFEDYKKIKDKINLHKLPRKSSLALFQMETWPDVSCQTPVHNVQYEIKITFSVEVTLMNISDYKETIQLLYIGQGRGKIMQNQIIPVSLTNNTKCKEWQIKGKESENSYQKLKRLLKDRHTQTHENSIEIFRQARPSLSIGRE